MARLIGFRGFFCMVVAIACEVSARATAAETLRLVADVSPPFENLGDEQAPGFGVEVLRRVFADMGQNVSFETFPNRRSWAMIARGEADGIFSGPSTAERQRICSFPDEPLKQEKWVFFVRAVDVGRLRFSSFDDLVGHQVAVPGIVPGLFEQSILPPDLWKILRERNGMVEANGAHQGLQMLAAGRVDYAFENLTTGMRDIAAMGLSGKIEPLMSSGVVEGGTYICFSRTRVSAAFIAAFSRALKEFKQTEAFQDLRRKYFPNAPALR
jgi:polar amino acid transport system substrate-binding protein